MKTKNLFLFSCLFILSFLGYTQQNPNKEILVFFVDGVSQEVKTINGRDSKSAHIDREKLRQSLEAIGVNDSTIEVALPKFNKADTLMVLSDGQRLKQSDMTKLFKIKVPKGRKRQEMIDYLNKLPEVLYAEPNGKVVPHAIPSDTRFNDQWGLRNTITPGADIHAVAAWDIYTGNPNNIIAIIDGGTEISHPDLNDKIAGGDTDFGWSGHGVHVSGIAAAESNNSQGISGFDWNARIHPQRIDNVDDAGMYQAIVDAVNYSPNVFVLNNSWGLVDENQNPGRYSTTVRQAFAYAYKTNRTCVASMGNFQQTNPGVIGYPAGFGNIITVGATDNTDVIAGFSAQGSHIDVCAPGVDILSTINGTYGNMSGTSMAAPHVSGISSLLKGFNPNLANDDIENIIKLSADDRGNVGFDNAYGFGRVNAERALNLLRAPNTLNQWNASGGTVFSSTGTFTAQFLGAPGLSSANYIVKRYEVRKAITFPSNFLCIGGVWGRGVSTTGWNLSSPNFGEGFCEVIPGTQTNTGVTLRTYVYEIWSISGSYLGYYPQSPSNVSFAYSVSGILSPIISGPSLVCTSGSTYTLTSLPSGLTGTWTCTSTNNNLAINPTTGYAYATNSTPGQGTISAVINTGCGNITLPAQTVWVGAPVISSISGPTSTPNNQWATYTAQLQSALSAPTAYNWILNPLNGNSVYNYGSTCDIAFYNSGSYQLVVQAKNTCSGAGYGPYYVTGIYVYNSYRLSISPNPTTTEATIELVNTSTEKATKETEWDLEVYDAMQSMKAKVQKIKDNKQTLSTSGWKEGVYIVRAIIGQDIITGKLVVKP